MWILLDFVVVVVYIGTVLLTAHDTAFLSEEEGTSVSSQPFGLCVLSTGRGRYLQLRDSISMWLRCR